MRCAYESLPCLFSCKNFVFELEEELTNFTSDLRQDKDFPV